MDKNNLKKAQADNVLAKWYWLGSFLFEIWIKVILFPVGSEKKWRLSFLNFIDPILGCSYPVPITPKRSALMRMMFSGRYYDATRRRPVAMIENQNRPTINQIIATNRTGWRIYWLDFNFRYFDKKLDSPNFFIVPL